MFQVSQTWLIHVKVSFRSATGPGGPRNSTLAPQRSIGISRINTSRFYSHQEILAASLAPSSTTAYRQSVLNFLSSYDANLKLFPIKPFMLLNYIKFIFNKGLSQSTITSQLSAVSYIHNKLANVSYPSQSFIIKQYIKGVQKLTQIDIRLPFNFNHASAMIEVHG